MRTRITELLGIEYPIIQGGMAWVAEYHLAAAVSNAGGLGLIGTASAPAECQRTLTMVFNSVGLPIEGIALIMGIDRILDMTRTAVNITGDAVCTTIVASWNKAVDRDVYYRRK